VFARAGWRWRGVKGKLCAHLHDELGVSRLSAKLKKQMVDDLY